MRRTRLFLAAVALCLAGCAARAPAPAAPAGLMDAFGAVLQGEGSRAVGILERIDPATLTGRQHEVRACMLARLGRGEAAQPPIEDAFLAQALRSYREYWLRVLLAEQAPADAERWLLDQLNALVASNGGRPAQTLDELEPALAAMIRARGAWSLHGVTLPLREFMVWRTQAAETYDVRLPEGRQAVRVEFMDDFVSLGWSGFATCGVSHSGGWTKPEALYAVRSAYDLDSETFRVSYLVHEAQHFADNRRFPGLEQPELEYRAKLAELAMAQATAHDLLEKFAANTSDDRGVPHSHANRRVVTEIGDWRPLDAAAISAAARKLLESDSRGRAAR